MKKRLWIIGSVLLLAAILLLAACSTADTDTDSTIWDTGYCIRSRPYCVHSWMPETIVRYYLTQDGYFLYGYTKPLIFGKLEQVQLSERAFLSLCPPPETFWHENYTAQQLWSETQQIWYAECENTQKPFYLLQLKDGRLALAWLDRRTSTIWSIEILEAGNQTKAEIFAAWEQWQSESSPEWIAFCERFNP